MGLLLATGAGLSAQVASHTPVLRSASGQFSVFDRRGAAPPALPASSDAKGFFELEPAFLTVSCERIKNALDSELGAPNRWRGKIQVTISPVRNTSDDYAITVDRFNNGWNYQVNLPQRVERTMFVRTLLQVLLLELANRQANERSAEVPFWLVEGLTQRLLISRAAELILPPPDKSIGGISVRRIVIESRDNDPLEAARRVLRERPPLTLEELSYPRNDEFAGPAGDAYRRSSQLFVSELLRLNNGRACLLDTVMGLGSCYNWQTAFLKAFQAQFPNQLALEKWWALQVVYFVGRDPRQLWRDEESWRKLEETLLTPVAIRRTSGEMPARAEVTLQAIIREWDRARQLTTLRGKVRALGQTQSRVSPEFIALTDGYRRVLTDYLREIESASSFSDLESMPAGVKKYAMESLGRLDELDVKRRVMQPNASGNWSAVPPPSPAIRR